MCIHFSISVTSGRTSVTNDLLEQMENSRFGQPRSAEGHWVVDIGEREVLLRAVFRVQADALGKRHDILGVEHILGIVPCECGGSSLICGGAHVLTTILIFIFLSYSKRHNLYMCIHFSFWISD